MKIKTKVKIIEILFVISLIISILSIRSTYAKYQELVDTDYQVGIRKWLIVVNEKDIQDETIVMSDVLQPTLVENEYMRSDILVPGREGYFEFDLDYTSIDVPFTYSFDVYQSNEETKQLSDFEFTGYSIEYPIIQEDFKFLINSAENQILYIQTEEDETTGEITETVLTEAEDTGTEARSLEVLEEMEDPDTGESLGTTKVLTAAIVVDTETNEKLITVKQKIIDSLTEEEIEEEKEIFIFTQAVDETTNQPIYTVVNSLDPTELEAFERHQNIKLHFKWNDTETNQMDNAADVAFSGVENPDTNVNNTLLKYKASMKFKQYVPIAETDTTEAQTTDSTEEQTDSTQE